MVCCVSCLRYGVFTDGVFDFFFSKDWLLGFLYRTMNIQFRIAGTSPVQVPGESKIMNVNLTETVAGHLDYHYKLTEVLQAVGLKVDESGQSTACHSGATTPLDVPISKSFPSASQLAQKEKE